VQPTVQAQFPQEDCATKLLGCEDALRREHCSNDREREHAFKPYLKPVAPQVS
jgi:hypothetical protein